MMYVLSDYACCIVRVLTQDKGKGKAIPVTGHEGP
jgi:hypothetical protein